MPNYITYRVNAMAFNNTYNNISELNPTTIYDHDHDGPY